MTPEEPLRGWPPVPYDDDGPTAAEAAGAGYSVLTGVLAIGISAGVVVTGLVYVFGRLFR